MIVTITLIIITVAVSISSFNNKELLYRWIFNPYQVYTYRQYYRFFSSGFIHSDYIHLIFNMIALFYFGRAVEDEFDRYGVIGGKILFLILYLGGIIISDIPTYLKHRHNPRYNSLGASGGVASVLFGAILYKPMSLLCLYGLLCLPAFILGTLYLIYSYYSGKNVKDKINHDAHLYGAFFGIAFTVALNPPVVIGFLHQIKDFSLF